MCKQVKPLSKWLTIKLNKYLGEHSTYEETVQRLKTARHEYKVAQTIAHKLEKDFQNEYISRCVKDQKVSPNVMKKMMSSKEHSRDIGRISKDIHECNNRTLVLKATVICSITGVKSIIKIHEKIVEAAAKSNLKCQCKTEGTAFRIYPLLQDFRYCADNKINVDAVLNGTYIVPPGTDQYVKEFIKTLSLPEFIWAKNTINLLVMPEEQKMPGETESNHCLWVYHS